MNENIQKVEEIDQSKPSITATISKAIESIEVLQGNIIHLEVEAIVNAANESLLGGGGVDGAIHQAAGPDLLSYCKNLDGCQTGLAKITPAFDMEASGIKHIIHTVGPVWQGDSQDIGQREDEKLSNRMEDVLLASCYQQSLALAKQHGIQSLAFPAISTGVYGFPIERATRIAFGHVLGWLMQNPESALKKIIFCCFSESDAAIYRETIETRDQWMFNRKRA